jgi:hypothetical protein
VSWHWGLVLSYACMKPKWFVFFHSVIICKKMRIICSFNLVTEQRINWFKACKWCGSCCVIQFRMESQGEASKEATKLNQGSPNFLVQTIDLHDSIKGWILKTRCRLSSISALTGAIPQFRCTIQCRAVLNSPCWKWFQQIVIVVSWNWHI